MGPPVARRIPQSFIDELVARADVVELIDSFVPLKKAGKDYVACCPFHEEKTPSFSVSQSKQFYYCFGCQAHGTALGFLMDYQGLGFTEAVEELAQQVGMEVPHERDDTTSTRDGSGLYDVLNEASAYYARALREHDDAGRAVDYLKARGVSGDVAAKYRLGYAPAGWDNLLSAVGRTDEKRRLLGTAGMAIERTQGQRYDRFRDRIMFPIHDRRGRVIGFGGRVLDAEQSPKYLNSPETPVFHKGLELYGLFEAQKEARKLDRLFVVEGYMDVVSLAQFGIPNAVATLGTAATTEQMRRLFRVTRDVVFCFDGDTAGRRAAWRALENLLPLMEDGWQAAFIFLPEGEDPDSVVRSRGSEGFLALAAQATNLSEFLFAHLLEQSNTRTVEGCARLVALARPLLGQVKARAYRELAIERLADLSGMRATELATLIKGGGRGSKTKRSRGTAASSSRSSPSLVRKVITMLLHHPQLAAGAGDVTFLAHLDMPGTDLLGELLDLLASHPNLNTGGIVEHFRSHEAGRHLAKLASQEPPVLSQGLESEFSDCLGKLAQMVDQQRYEELRQQAQVRPLSEHEESEFRRLVASSKQPENGASERGPRRKEG